MANRRSLLSWVRLPFWALQLATGAKSFEANPVIGSKTLNRLGLHKARVRLASRLAWSRRARLAGAVSADHAEQLDRNGFVVIRDYLPDDVFQALRQQVLDRPAPTREMVQGDTITRRIAIDAVYLAAVPQMRSLISSHTWRGLMRFVAGYDAEPLYYIQSILKQQSDAPPDPQTALHADAFHPSMKAWFFLNDVAEDAGPFTYVPGSHRLTPQRLAWEKAKSIALPEDGDVLSARGSLRVEEGELASLGYGQPQALAVPANTLVVADTFGFHARGPSAGALSRVEIWAYSRRSPFLPFTGFDLLSLPGIAERRVPALWWFRDKFERWVGQPWRNVGEKTPLDSTLG